MFRNLIIIQYIYIFFILTTSFPSIYRYHTMHTQSIHTNIANIAITNAFICVLSEFVSLRAKQQQQHKYITFILVYWYNSRI